MQNSVKFIPAYNTVYNVKHNVRHNVKHTLGITQAAIIRGVS